MKRNIIRINPDLCDGCGICIDACHEQALRLINGKAVLISDSYCDGLGDCLPACPQNAIEITVREAAPYDDDMVKARLKTQASSPRKSKELHPPAVGDGQGNIPSQLASWPLQIQLVAPNAPFLQGAHLLIAADCTPFAYRDFHKEFLHGRVCLIGCPKLDDFNYSEKLAEILRLNTIQSITVAKMEVPCCTGTVGWVREALEQEGQSIPWSICTITLDGQLLEG